MGAVNLRFHAAAALVVAVSIIVERPPAQWLDVFLDRVSVVHLLVCLGLVAFWALVAPRVADAGARSRMAAAALSGGAIAALIAAVAPAFFLGPYASLDPALVAVWLPGISEVHPETLTPRRILLHLGAPAVALAATAAAALRTASHRPARAALLVPLSVTLVLGIFQFRWLLYAEALGAALLAVAISDASVTLRGSPLQPWVRSTLAVAGTFGWVVVGSLPWPTANSAPEFASTSGCSDQQAVAALDGLGPSTIATYVDLGPVILYHTSHAVLAAPYLHNSGNRVVIGTLDAPLAEADPAELRERGVNLVLVCPAGRDAYLVAERDGRETLYGALVRGRHPAWLTPVGDPVESAPVRLYRLTGSAVPVAHRGSRVSRAGTEWPDAASAARANSGVSTRIPAGRRRARGEERPMPFRRAFRVHPGNPWLIASWKSDTLS